jgi:dimethylhistidine N-methyltransferase
MQGEVLEGLARAEKWLPCKYFYDAVGSELFERICELPEYYLTRTELGILELHVAEMAAALGPRVRLVEFGSGSSTKTRLLLDRLQAPAAYVPVDLAADMLARSTAALRARYPALGVLPLCCDYTEGLALPPAPPGTARTVCYFPGSTIGNFTDAEAEAFLHGIARVCGHDGGLLLGADLEKDLAVLLPAYADASGVTAAFNKNLLRRVNVELGADFALDAFEHRSIWNGRESRIEMQLISRAPQTAHVAGVAVPFRAAEVLTTEYSHKYTLAGLAELAGRAGFAVEKVWTDARAWFAVLLLRVR